MTLQSLPHTRVPVDDTYAALVGKAVYIFAYYEWIIIYIMEYLKPGFAHDYSRGKPMTSGVVADEFKKMINSAVSFAVVSQMDFQECHEKFKRMIDKRNALIHAHPCTDADGNQILAYQTNPAKGLPDMRWPQANVEVIIHEFDEAACSALELRGRLLNNRS
jgi:hypothetical protein